MACVPMLIDDTVSVATPPDNAPLPMTRPASMNDTGPVGAPATDLIDAVKVTACPAGTGLADEVSVMLVALTPPPDPPLTVSVVGDDEPAAKVASPLYVA